MLSSENVFHSQNEPVFRKHPLGASALSEPSNSIGLTKNYLISINGIARITVIVCIKFFLFYKLIYFYFIT